MDFQPVRLPPQKMKSKGSCFFPGDGVILELSLDAEKWNIPNGERFGQSASPRDEKRITSKKAARVLFISGNSSFF